MPQPISPFGPVHSEAWSHGVVQVPDITVVVAGAGVAASVVDEAVVMEVDGSAVAVTVVAEVTAIVVAPPVQHRTPPVMMVCGQHDQSPGAVCFV
mmetsp:Transcript_59804/g.173237  ORF Transcript_59804/g.173237 Transcript_59804/m.173237 type:complete len:95 (-) Transcript_59804:240-524(-)